VPRYGRIDEEYGRHLATSLAAETIYMLNLTRYHPEAGYRRGSGGTGYGATSRGSVGAEHEADIYHAPITLLTAHGAALRFVADVVASSGDWDRVAVVSYPSRRAFIEMAARQDFREWHARKQAAMDSTVVMGMLPVGQLPRPASSSLAVLEIWDGPAPNPVADGQVAAFDIEGTIIGDGRDWTGARYTVIEPGTPLPLQPPRPDYQALLLQPTIEHWQWTG